MQVDWWSLGALLYEMLAGRPPHYSKDRNEMLKNIVGTPVPMKPYFEPVTCEFLTALLERDPVKRLGGFLEGCQDDASEIRNHPYFDGIDWYQIRFKNH